MDVYGCFSTCVQCLFVRVFVCHARVAERGRNVYGFFNCLCTRMRVYTCPSIYCFEGVYMYVCVRVLMQVYARVFMLILALSLSR